VENALDVEVRDIRLAPISTGVLIYCAVQPPSIRSVAPVIKEEASEAKKMIGPASSSGLAMRPKGMRLTK